MPPELHEILAHAAVEGASFDAAVLAYVLDKDELHVMKLLQPAEDEHDLIDYVGDVDLGKDVTVRYRFSSNLFQRQLLESLRGKKRLNAFRRSAEGLDQLWPDDSEDLAPSWPMPTSRARCLMPPRAICAQRGITRGRRAAFRGPLSCTSAPRKT